MTTRVISMVLLIVSVLFAGAVTSLFAQDDDSCFACHGQADLSDDPGEAARLHVESEAYLRSVHSEMGFSCVDCHADLAGEELPHAERLAPVACNDCHDDVVPAYAESVHGYALRRGNVRAPTCSSCHGTHEILPASDPDSPVYPATIPSTCGSCHGLEGRRTDQIVKLPQSFTDYARSVHGPHPDSTDSDTVVAVPCTACHGSHDLKHPSDPRSRINRANVAETCGTCHPAAAADYAASIHGRAARAGIGDSPTCTGCHGEHLILPSAETDSRTHANRLAVATCGRCHDDPRIIARYDLDGGVVGSYVDSYHGWTSRGDTPAAATCASCHSAHSVLPAEHMDSTIHPANVGKTCGKCHEGVDARFAASYSHEAASITANPINRWIRRFYISMIAIVVGAMALHNLVILNYFIVEKRRQVEKSATLVRFDITQIVLHLLLAGSFIILTITGFALRYPEAWWVRWLSWIGFHELARSTLHRACAVALIVSALAHLVHSAVTRRGRADLMAILPRMCDLREFRDALRFYTWRSATRVDFGQFDYTQKLEYWALVWGTGLMIVTGFVLWFPEAAVRWLPTWIVAASQTIHYYEAWLAMLAILVWHFFFVIFHPDEYPMSWTWITGKMGAHAATEHHPRWYRDTTSVREPGRPRKQ